MYPANLLSLFPPFPRTNRVFVAMSFDERLQRRWSEVIQPAIESISVNDQQLLPHRVDATRVSDAIVTEIVRGISEDILVFADVTTLEVIGQWAIRNGNVMYELGIAHAVRQPEEVVVFRSDDDQLLFDVAGVRVHRYQPEQEVAASRKVVGEALVDALRAVESTKAIAVEKVAKSLDLPSWSLIFMPDREISPPIVRTMRDVMAGTVSLPAIARLLDLGVLETIYLPQFSGDDPAPKIVRAEETIRYRLTPFGRAVWGYGIDKLGITLERLRRWGGQNRPNGEAPGD